MSQQESQDLNAEAVDEGEVRLGGRESDGVVAARSAAASGSGGDSASGDDSTRNLDIYCICLMMYLEVGGIRLAQDQQPPPPDS